MATAKRARPRPKGHDDERDVDDFMQGLDHPLKPALELVRRLILGADPRVREGIKWNAPSFRLDDWFATVNIRKDAVLVILHQGARVRDGSRRPALEDPAGLLEWLGKDRAAVTFRDLKAVRAHKTAFSNIARQRIARMPRAHRNA
jgi:hypothetical protein